MKEPLVTIELQEYNKLKDLKDQFQYLVDNFKIEGETVLSHEHCEAKFVKTGVIDRKSLEHHFKNLFDIDVLVIK